MIFLCRTGGAYLNGKESRPMRYALMLLVVVAVVLAGCGGDKEKEELQVLEKQNNDLAQQLVSKDSSIHNLTLTLNEIRDTLEAAATHEKTVASRLAATEEIGSSTIVGMKERMLDEIAQLASTLRESRRRIAAVEHRITIVENEKQSLGNAVDSLKKILDARDISIAGLQSRVTALESEVAAKAQAIQGQKRQLNTVYYVVGTRNDLEQKDIIRSTGGFLWGLLGSTTVLTSNYSEQAFQALDKVTGTTIDVPGEIDEMVPERESSSYSKEVDANGHTRLVIVKPDEFWKANHLAIIID
jgi:archaellum component FlaC